MKTPWGGLSDLLADVAVVRGAVPQALDGATAAGVLWQVAPGAFLLEAPQVARYLVEDGVRVTVEPLTDDTAQVDRFLRMTPLAALLNQRGQLALHAAAAAKDGAAVVLAGFSSSGKSTLLAELLQRGWQMLADDLTVVDDQSTSAVVAWPLVPELALWPDAAARLGYVAAPAARTLVEPADRLADGPVPVRAVVVLREDRQAAGGCLPLPGGEAFQALSTLSYNNHVAEAILGALPNLLLCARVLGRVPALSLNRAQGGWAVGATAALLEEALAHG